MKEEERQQYKKLMDTVNWFFFDLLILGYVEDPATGSSFRLPGGLCWAIFVEVILLLFYALLKLNLMYLKYTLSILL